MKSELESLKRDWDAKLKKAGQKTDQLLDSAVRGGKLDELSEELKRKTRDLQDLLSKKAELERQINSSEPSLKDSELANLRQDLASINKQFLDLLEEQNRIFEDLTS